ncbi:hypothetical protein ACIPSE_45680 [Streptomyces sp. NPDC090106]|uniref:hypothetical protein n=1 Tax=Streptomyces sp. NPDC090106 TaxID=3365946 RepID=UPI0037FBF0D0
MSTTPQMSQPGQHQGQQFPSTAPYQQFPQQPFGPQGISPQQQFGQQAFGPQHQPFGMGGSLEQLQQLGRQQPYQGLLQQLGQQQPFAPQQPQQPQQEMGQQHQQVEQQVQQHLQQISQIAVQYVQQQVQAQVLQAGAADGYIDVVQPLPGQPSVIALRVAGQLKVLFDPNPQTHDQVQEAFAFGHQVIGVWESGSPQILRSIQIRRI